MTVFSRAIDVVYSHLNGMGDIPQCDMVAVSYERSLSLLGVLVNKQLCQERKVNLCYQSAGTTLSKPCH